MKHNKKLIAMIVASIGMFLLVLDTKTAITGAKDGLDLCLQAVIPSLLPFFVLSSVLTSGLVGMKRKTLRPLGKLCGVPSGAESLLILGFLAGYPVGARMVYDAYKNGSVSKRSAQRLLGFCNNAGPAFIFGMVGVAFTTKGAAWALWAVLITSAVLVGFILPNKDESSCSITPRSPIPLTATMEGSLRAMAIVCGWVILFRVILAVLERWIFWGMPTILQIFLSGLLELSNGCFMLRQIPLEGARFIIGTVMLSIGGICVGMQTASVTKELGVSAYVRGKILQGIFSFMLSAVIQRFIFPHDQCVKIPIYVFGVIILTLFVLKWLLARKKVVAICR